MMKRTAEEENFSDWRDFLGRQCGGEGRTDRWCSSGFSRASPSCAGVKFKKASIPNVSLLPSEKNFLPMGVWAAMWFSNVEGLRF